MVIVVENNYSDSKLNDISNIYKVDDKGHIFFSFYQNLLKKEIMPSAWKLQRFEKCLNLSISIHLFFYILKWFNDETIFNNKNYNICNKISS